MKLEKDGRVRETDSESLIKALKAMGWEEKKLVAKKKKAKK